MDALSNAIVEIMSDMTEEEQNKVYDLIWNYDICDEKRRADIAKYASGSAQMRILELKELKQIQNK